MSRATSPRLLLRGPLGIEDLNINLVYYIFLVYELCLIAPTIIKSTILSAVCEHFNWLRCFTYLRCRLQIHMVSPPRLNSAIYLGVILSDVLVVDYGLYDVS